MAVETEPDLTFLGEPVLSWRGEGRVERVIIFLHGSGDCGRGVSDWLDSLAVRPRLESPVTAQSGNVGKLKISSEMKDKLEAAMGSRKSSVREGGNEKEKLEGISGEEDVKCDEIAAEKCLLPGGDRGGGMGEDC